MEDFNFKETCRRLRKEGHTLSQIVLITGRPKTSVHFHISDIPLNPKTKERVRKESGLRIREYSIARKGKSTKSFNRFSKWTPDLVLLLSHLMFDGEITRGVCSYNNRSLSLIKRVEGLMKKLYEYEPKRYVEKQTGVTRIAYHNVEMGAYLQKRATELCKVVHTLPPTHKKEFLRAFFDDEGCMDFRPKRNKRNIRGYQKNREVLIIIEKLLKDLGIDAHIEEPNEVVISKKENLGKFQKEIDFSLGVRVNGNRTNSTWKKDMEKSLLLSMAIDSYKS